MNSERRFEPEKLGLGLCEGYDKMGHALSKPYLRAELENQLKDYKPTFSKVRISNLKEGVITLTDLHFGAYISAMLKTPDFNITILCKMLEEAAETVDD